MQIPVSFRLLPFTIHLKWALIFALLGLSLFSCHMNPNYQGKGETYLQGEWQQDSVAVATQLLTYSTYHLKFDCDSFYFKINTTSKVNTGADTCMKSGHWSEYIKGVYKQSHDTVFMDGFFCDARYKLKEDGGCFRSGVYRDFFKVTKKADSLIQFSISSGVIPINAHLINRTVCNPKPL